VALRGNGKANMHLPVGLCLALVQVFDTTSLLGPRRKTCVLFLFSLQQSHWHLEFHFHTSRNRVSTCMRAIDVRKFAFVFKRLLV